MSRLLGLISLPRSRRLWFLLLCVGLVRIVSLSTYPLLDTTEARYGEIARIMAETGNWLVPQIDYGVPFWGKPPLSFWASALSIELFTNSEFFLRLPHVLAAIAVLVLVWQLVLAMDYTRHQADIAVAVVATSIGFLIAAGLVMTDMYLCLAMTMTMAGFWRGWHGERAYVYLMYAGLGIGLLAKGPVIIALAALALIPWLLITQGIRGMWKPLWQRLDLPAGILLALAISVPWYWAAERANPGFLEYFILGEHFQRFIVSDWRGDLYGTGHARAHGMIWIYWLELALPWSPIVLFAIGKALVRAPMLLLRDNQLLFALLWMCSPMLLFTLASNILPAYVLPGIPAIALLTVKLVHLPGIRNGRYLLLVGPVLLIILCAYAALVAGDKRSDRELLADGITSNDPLYYLHKRPFSAQYYSNGRAKIIESMPRSGHFYLVIDNDLKLNRVDEFCEIRAANQERQLFFCRRSAPA